MINLHFKNCYESQVKQRRDLGNIYNTLFHQSKVKVKRT